MSKIAVLDHRITPETQRQINELSDEKVVFPDALLSEDEFVSRTGNADVVLVSPWIKITAAHLDACPNIRYVGLCGTSTANIDLDELKKRNIAFSNIVSHDKEAVAEFFFMELVALARGVGKHVWRGGLRELKDKHTGIIGLGHVGQAIAHMALAYKMRTSYYSPNRKANWEDRGVHYCELPELLKKNDIIVICSPTNVEVLGEAEFKLLRSDSIVIQASGGTAFDKKAFTDWVKQEGNFAIFDLSAGESNYQDYRHLPHIIFSRMVAGDTYEANQRRSKRVLENLIVYLASTKA